MLFEADVERPQLCKHDIRPVETMAVEFKSDDDFYPEILALRTDFPRDVPHLNLRPPGHPPSLCLYEITWPEVRLAWTPAAFIERIRWWLAQTARGTLHGDDQALEPLLAESGFHLVLPLEVFSTPTSQMPERLAVTLQTAKEPRVLIAHPSEQFNGVAALDYVAAAFRVDPQPHGVIHHQPQTLGELHDFVQSVGLDLLHELRSRFTSWLGDHRISDQRLIIIIAFPKTRGFGDRVEATDLWAFLTSSTVAEVGLAIGCYRKGGIIKISGQSNMLPRVPQDASMKGERVHLDLLRPHFALDRDRAALFSGRGRDDRRITAVGMGALGSQVLFNLAREGFGRWSLIDDDYLLPHNLVRHALLPFAIGHTKAEALEFCVNTLLNEEGVASALPVNILQPGAEQSSVDEALGTADLILDMSASLPVARHLALDVESESRRLSLFLNPTGTDLVLLSEDRERSHPLDALEMQYYRAVATQLELERHLRPATGQSRYARSCRDITSAIPQSRVAILSGIAAQAVRQATDDQSAAIHIWCIDPLTCEVTAVCIAVSRPERRALGNWTMCIDRSLIESLQGLREKKLPNETGGVLLGAFDLQRHMIYIVDTIPSPPDSVEYPTLYIRGAQGLAQAVRAVGERTAGHLRYTGEWHSHPDGSSCAPSADDEKVFSWLEEEMAGEGLPPVMAIVGRNEARFFATDLAVSTLCR